MPDHHTARWVNDPTVPDPVKDWAHLLSGLFQADLHDRLLEEVAEHEDWLAEHPALRPGVLHQRAYAALETGDFVLAIRSCKASVEADRNVPKVRGNLDHLQDRAKDRIHTLYRQARWAEVEALSKAAIEAFSPVPDWAFWQLGVARDHTGRSDEAADLFRRLTTQNPLHEGAWTSLVVSLRHARRPGDALQALDEGIRTLGAYGRGTDSLEAMREGLQDHLADQTSQPPVTVN